MMEDQDMEILKKLKHKRKSFVEIVNRKNVDDFELERAMQEEL